MGNTASKLNMLRKTIEQKYNWLIEEKKLLILYKNLLK